MRKLSIVLFLIFSISFTPIAAKFAVSEFSPVSLAFLRFGLAEIFFLIVLYIRKSNLRIEKTDHIKFLILGLLVIPINQLCFLNGIKLSYASHSGVIYSCTPLFAYLLSIKIKDEAFSYRTLVPIILTILGIFIIFYENIIKIEVREASMIYGDLLLIGAVGSWAAYLTLSKDMTKKYGALKTSTLSFLIGLAIYLPFFLFDIKNLEINNITSTGLIAFLHLSIIVAFLAYFIFIHSTKYIKISTLTTLTNISPIVTIIFSWIFLKEEITYFFIIGAMTTLSGVFLSHFNNNKVLLDKFT